MAKLKKNTYWLLLTAFLFLLGIVLCVGETTARYQNTALRNTVVQPAESGSIVSDCLVSGEQIILLGNMSVEEEGKTVEIRFASAASAIATLECICDSEYLSAELNTAELILDGGIATAELYVAPTDAAMSLEDNAEVDVLVEMYSETEGTVLSGTFRVTLIPIPRVTTTATTAQASPEVPAESTAATTTAATTTVETTTTTAPATTSVASTETTPAVTTATAATETTVTTPVETTATAATETTVTTPVETTATAATETTVTTPEETAATAAPEITETAPAETTVVIETETAPAETTLTEAPEITETMPVETTEATSEAETEATSEEVTEAPPAETEETVPTETAESTETEASEPIVQLMLLSVSDEPETPETITTAPETTVAPEITTETPETTTAAPESIETTPQETTTASTAETPETTPVETTATAAAETTLTTPEETTTETPAATTATTPIETTTEVTSAATSADTTVTAPAVTTATTTAATTASTTQATVATEPSFEAPATTTESSSSTPSAGDGEVHVPESADMHAEGDLDVVNPDVFSIGSTLFIDITLPKYCYMVRMNLSDGEMPAYTRYSIDDGETWYMLYYGGVVEFDAYGQESAMILLDMSLTDCESGEPLSMIVAAYGSGRENGRYCAQIEATPYGVETTFRSRTYSSRKSGTLAVLGEAEEDILTVYCKEGLEDCDRTYTFELLTAYDGEALYERVSDDAFYIAYDEDLAAVSVSVGDTLPQAGTYRLTIEYSYDGTYIDDSETVFFVNYMADTRSGS